jgi:hypothetical protein
MASSTVRRGRIWPSLAAERTWRQIPHIAFGYCATPSRDRACADDAATLRLEAHMVGELRQEFRGTSTTGA